MKKFSNYCFGLVSLFLLSWVGCANPGVEVGNPNLEGKTIALSLQGSNLRFSVLFQAQSTASVSKIQENLVDTVVVPYTYNFPKVNLAATFTDQTRVEISLTVNEEGEFTESALTLNGQTVGTMLEMQSNGPKDSSIVSCDTGTDNAGLMITQALCSQIVTCLGGIACTSCEEAVLEIQNLGFDFGGSPGNSLKDIAEEIDQGKWQADPEALAQCMMEIPLIDCAVVATAVMGDPPTDYSNLRAMIPKPSCARGVLKETVPSGNGNEAP